MQSIDRRIVSCLLLCAALEACAQEALLGDNRTIAASADGGAPSIQGGFDDGRGPVRFDVSEQRLVAPTWRYDFDCGGESCARSADVSVAPDGGIWAALLGGYIALSPGQTRAVDTSELVLVHLALDGKVLAEHSRSVTSSALSEWGSPLSIDEDGRPFVLRWPTLANKPYPPARVIWLEGEQLLERPLPGGIAKEDTSLLAGFPDGSLLEFSTQKEARAVRYSVEGERLWRAKDLRALPQSQGGSPNPAPPVVFLSDGSIVLSGLAKTTGVGAGLTVLGADGDTRWDMTHPLSGSLQQLAAGPDGGLLLAGMSAVDQDLGVFAYDRSGNLLRSFRGARVGFHTVAPRGLGCDQNGDIYVAVVVGSRSRPLLSVCKLGMQDDATPLCLALDLAAAERSENTVVTPFHGIRMEVAAPDVVLFALGHLVGEDLITSVLRVDLATPGVLSTPAQ
jgi:hypothetical protein